MQNKYYPMTGVTYLYSPIRVIAGSIIRPTTLDYAHNIKDNELGLYDSDAIRKAKRHIIVDNSK